MKSIFKTVGFLVFILFLGLLKPVISQNVKANPDARLYQVYDKKYIDDLIKTNPDKIKYLNYANKKRHVPGVPLLPLNQHHKTTSISIIKSMS